MSRRGFNKKEKNTGGAPGWMITYSDLMSLLLTFFILLYSMSNIDAAKFKSISQSLQGVLSGLGYTHIIETPDNPPTLSDEILDLDDSSNMNNIKEGILLMHERVSDYVSQEGLDAKVTVRMNKRGVFVDINEAILFDPGSAKIKESGIQVLKKLEGLINDFENELVIEGHTDDVPMRTALYPSNWELSTARAVSVLRYLSEVEGVDPKRLSAVGCGEYRPMVPNNSVENRSINRRVNILIIFDEEDGEINNE
jgi:chemotaxis protein MotB